MALLGLPSLAVNGGLLSYIVIAVSMVAITIFVLGAILPRRGESPLITQMTLAVAILFGGGVLVLSLVFCFLNPDGAAAWTWVLLAFNFMMVGPAGLWFIGLIVFRDRRLPPGDWLWSAAIAAVISGSEVLMGIVFALGISSGSVVTAPVLAEGVSSIWFFWSMASVMTALLLWAPIGRAERWVLVALTVSAFVGPWVTAYPTLGGAAMAALMAGVFLGILRELGRPGRVAADEAGVLIGLAAAFLLMALTGASVAFTNGSTGSALAFGGGMALVMTVEIAYLVRRFYHGPMRTPWVVRSPDPEAPGPETPTLVPGSGETRPAPSMGPAPSPVTVPTEP